ncbi:pectate lyase-like adhesive domain-containing protein, partial [Lactiplantibacillus plantarum]
MASSNNSVVDPNLLNNNATLDSKTTASMLNTSTNELTLIAAGSSLPSLQTLKSATAYANQHALTVNVTSASTLATSNTTTLPVASDKDAGRASFDDNSNANTGSATSVNVPIVDQVANKATERATAIANGTYAKVTDWTGFTSAYNNNSITYIELGGDVSAGNINGGMNDTGAGNPLNPRTSGIIIDGNNNTLDLGLNVSMFVGTATAGTQFTLTDINLMQEQSQGSPSSGSYRSVIQTPFAQRTTNDGLWTFNINNVQYVGGASLTSSVTGKYGYVPGRLVDMEDSLVNFSGTIKWYSSEELATLGAVTIANGTTINYGQTYVSSDNDSVFYFMAWDHQNTVNDTGAAHNIKIGNGSTLDFKATTNGNTQDRSVFYNSWTDMNIGDNVSWTQNGFTQLFNSYSDRALYGGSTSGLGYDNAFFTSLPSVGHDLNNRSINAGEKFTLNVPSVQNYAFYLDTPWTISFAAGTTLNINQTSNNNAVVVTGGGKIIFVSPKSLSIQNYNGAANSSNIFNVSGSGTITDGTTRNSSFSLNNSSMNYWLNGGAMSTAPASGTLKFRSFSIDNTGYKFLGTTGNNITPSNVSALHAFNTNALGNGTITLEYVDQYGNVLKKVPLTLSDTDNYIGETISLIYKTYSIDNVPANYMWAIGNQVYTGAKSDAQSGG